MAHDLAAPRSRRALLGAAAGAAAATAVGAVVRPLRTEAVTDQHIYLNNEDDNTVLEADSIHQAGFPDSGHGIAISGRSTYNNAITGYSGPSDAIFGSAGTGAGVSGSSDHGIGVKGVSAGAKGIGVKGLITSNGTASIGVEGDSPSGRGGRFSGGLAQVHLVPSAAASHPASGQRGDLFVDKGGRLWFCKGGTTWVRLA